MSLSTDKYCTPPSVLKAVYDFFGQIDLDPCSGEGSIVAANRVFTEADNGLAQDWSSYDKIFCNPPYSKPSLALWSDKCAKYQRTYQEILLLVPASTSAAWFQRNLFRTCDSILFYDKRISFLDPLTGKPAGSARFHSVLAYWGPRWGWGNAFETAFSHQGYVSHRNS